MAVIGQLKAKAVLHAADEGTVKKETLQFVQTTDPNLCRATFADREPKGPGTRSS